MIIQVLKALIKNHILLKGMIFSMHGELCSQFIRRESFLGAMGASTYLEETYV